MDANNDLFQVVFVIDESLWAKDSSGDVKVNNGNLVRTCVLKSLTYFSGPRHTTAAGDHCRAAKPRLEWGTKFFNSGKACKAVRDKPQFREFTLKYFEDFENEVEARSNARSFSSEVKAPAGIGSGELVEVDVFDAVKVALRSVIHDFPWDKPDISSPVKPVRSLPVGKNVEASSNRRTDLAYQEELENCRRNFVFVICECPQTLDEFGSNTVEGILKTILPLDVRRQLINNLGIRLFWIGIGNYSWKEDVSTACQNGCQLIDDALKTIGGRFIPSSALCNPGTFLSTYSADLFLCPSDNCKCSLAREEVASDCLNSKNSQPTCSKLADGVPALPIFPLSAVMDYYVNTRSSHAKEPVASLMLHLAAGLRSQPAISIKVIVQPIFSSSKSGLLEKLAEHCTNGCQRSPCAALLEENQLQCPHSVSLVSVATMLAGLLPLPACHSDDMYLLTADQQNKDMENRTETCCMLQPAKWGSDCASSNCNSAFQELLIHLSLLHQILLLELTGHQWPSLRYAILQPVTLSSATLMFLNDAIGSAIFPCCQHSSSLSQLPEKTSVVANDHIFSEIITRLPLLYSNHLTSLYGHGRERQRWNSLSRFNPAVLEPWYNPECCTDSADSIISSLPAKSAIKDSEERKLLRQLRSFYASSDGSQIVNNTGFCSPRTKRYFARQHRENVSSSVGRKSMQSALELDASKSENSLRVEPPRKAGGHAYTPNKKTSRSSVTPAKRGNRTPRKTPRKRSGRTPRKSSRPTPAKAKRTPAKSSGAMSTKPSVGMSTKSFGAMSTKSSGGMWRANLILQKSREAMMAKKTSSLKDDGIESASTQIKSVNLSVVKEQFTTTGWQDISSQDALVIHLKDMYGKVVEGEGTPLIGAKSIVTSSMHFYRNNGELNVPKSTCSMLRQHFLLKMPDLHAKYKGLTDSATVTNKLTEYQLQVLLRMEMEAECSTQCDDDAEPTESTEQLDEVVRILQAMSFIKDPGFLSSYLSDTLLLNYCDSSPRFLYQIYSQLILPIPSQLEHLRTPEETDNNDQSVPVPPSTLMSVSAGVRSGEPQADSSRQRKLYRSVTFTQVPQRRIEVPLRKPQVITPARRSSRIASASKTKNNHPADVSETKKVRRMLFDGSEADRRLSLPSALPRQKSEASVAPSRRVSDGLRTPKKSYQGLKTKVISETPAHKQGNRLQMKLELRQKRLSMDPSSMVVIAESPVKYSSDTVHTAKGENELSQALKRESFYSGRHSKYTKLEQRMTQRVSSPPNETICANYVAGSWLTSPRRITPKALFGALLSPSPDKPARNTPTERLTTSCRPEAVVSPSGAAKTSAAELVSPSRNTRSQVNRLSQPQKESIQSPRSAHAPIDDAAAERKELAPVNRSAGRVGLRQADVMSGGRRRVAFCRVLLPHESPELTSQDGNDDRPVAAAEGQLSEAVRREPPRVESNYVDGSNVAAAAATPVSKDKRLMKTPDSLDKWPRKKNRALMSRSPTPTSAVPSTPVAAAAATDAEQQAVRPSAANETAAVEQWWPEGQKSECIVAVHRLSDKFYEKSDATSLGHLTDSKPKRAENIVSSLAGRGVKRKLSGASAGTLGAPVYRTERHRTWTVDGRTDSGAAKSLELFGTDLDDADDIKQSSSNATNCRERATKQKIENFEPDDEQGLLLRKKRRRTRLVEPRWSSGLSSTSRNSLSERSPSPVFPSTSQCPVADKSASSVMETEFEVSTSGQTSPVFDKRLRNNGASEDRTPNLADTADRQLLSEGKSFSPNLTNSSIMHLMTSPLLNVADGKCRKYSVRGSSRRCLDEQMFAANSKP